MGWWGYLFASNKRTESVHQFSSNQAEWLWFLWSVRELFFQNAVHAIQTTESSKVSNIYSSGNKRYHYIFVTSIDVKTFQVLKNITKLTINEQEQDRTTIKVGECIGFVDVSERGWKIFVSQ